MSRFYIALLCLFLSSCKKSDQSTIVLVIPVEHTAMHDIEEGFVETLKAAHPKCHVDVKNAMGDPNMMQSILRIVSAQNIDYVATVGVSLTTAAQRLCPHQTIIGLAAYNKLADDHTYVVEDEVGAEVFCRSFKTVFPDVQKITLIHAQDDKILKEVKELEVHLQLMGVDVQHLPILHANDLPTVCPHIQGEVVILLKDHTVLTGLKVIKKYAQEAKIPVVVSDEGSVKNGATYALGVSEREIGVTGAHIVNQLIDKQKIEHIIKVPFSYIINKQTPSHLVDKMRDQTVSGISVVETTSHD